MGKFTEDDVKDLVGFAEFVAKKAKFELDWAEAVQLTKYQMFLKDLAKKINDHVIELKQVIQTEEEQKKSKKSKK